VPEELFDLTFKLEGVEGIVERLKLVSERMQSSIPRKAARRGMNIVRDSARAKLSVIDDPATRGSQIWRNIITQESGRRGRRLGGILMKVGVKGGSVTRRGYKRKFVAPGGVTMHWRHVELGTRFHGARSFMREALAHNLNAVADTVRDEIILELDKLVPPA